LISAQSQVYQESPVMFMFQGTLLIHYPQVLVMSQKISKFHHLRRNMVHGFAAEGILPVKE
jgi:hypothetical protein